MSTHSTRSALALGVALSLVALGCFPMPPPDGTGGGAGGGTGGDTGGGTGGGGGSTGGGTGGGTAGEDGGVDDGTAPVLDEEAFAQAGPCGQESFELANPYDADLSSFVYTPTGSEATPLTGGRCDDDERPVLFFAHGNLAKNPNGFSDLISHFVGQGYVFVFIQWGDWGPKDVEGKAYPTVEAGFVSALTEPHVVGRGDLARVGILGHSMGAGMVPFLVQRADAEGVGADALWSVAYAPYWAYGVGAEPTIDAPDRLRALIIAFDEDSTNDMAIGVEQFEALDLPDARKDHVTVYHDATLSATHTLPQSGGDTLLRIYGVYRNTNALGYCAMFGVNCDVDMTYMGLWPDEHAVVPAVVSDDPVDIGPGSLVDCNNTSPLINAQNPRVAYCP
jgi:hypothetical protein